MSAVLIPVLCVAVGVPVAVVQLRGEAVTVGPGWLWWLVFAGFVAALVATMLLAEHPRRWAALTLAVQVVLGAAAVLLLANGVGFVAILLVVTAALSCYVAPRPVTAGIVLANTAVVAFAASAGGASYEVVLTGLVYLVIQAMTVAAVASTQREERARRELGEAHLQLRATNALLAESTRSDERLRIARDLHDVLGHQLSALALELEVAAHRSEPPAAEHVLRARGIAKELLHDVRETVDDLRDDGGDLRTTLAQVVEGLPGPAVCLTVADDVVVDAARTTTLVRCVQEIATNTMRHAAARSLWIDIGRDDSGDTTLTARDDGWGAPDLRPGNGLRGIRERVEGLGGEVRFSGRTGFQVDLRVPAQ